MTTNTVLLILLSFVIACGLSFLLYFYRAKTKLKVNYVLAFLRFLSIFLVCLLIINPIVTSKKLEVIKTPLVVVADNSSSISVLNASKSAQSFFETIETNKDLKEKFDVHTYQFDNDFRAFDSQKENLNFKGVQTNLDQVGENLKSSYKNTLFPTLIITDGNQTSGNDYIYSFGENTNVYPIVVGDTTQFLDLKISQLNVNKYAFQKNKFPVEVFLNYSGAKSLSAQFTISQGSSTLYKQNVAFSKLNRNAILNVLLPADKVGLQIYKARIFSNEIEKNTYNNTKNFAVEVIDQKTNVVLVSAINHPDVGAIKRAIESNAQRKVTVVKPKEIKSLSDFNVMILYQPTAEFKSVFESNKSAGLNSFIVTGNHTDFNFLNQQQQNLIFKMSGQNEDYLSDFNTQFNLFTLENLGFENFPPLQNPFGNITVNGNVSVLLNSKIRNLATNAPQLAFAENEGKRLAFLLGENFWKWRLQSHLDHQSFEKFDVFVDKIIQFLASKNSKKSLVVNSELVYYSGNPIEITAQYFNKNFEFDDKARLSITLKNAKTKQTKNYDLLKSTSFYKVNLDGLTPGIYDFSVKELNTNTNYSGRFEVLDFDIEKQFVNPDLAQLSQLATQTNGKLYFTDQAKDLIKNLLENDNYKATQKEIVTKKPLIDWVWLLILLSLSLAFEWFVRKYNGLL